MKTKIFHGNQYVESFECDGKTTTKMQSFKKGFILWTRRLTIASFIFGAIYGGFQLGEYTADPIEVRAEVEVDKTNERFAEKIQGLKEKVADELMACESGGYKNDDGIIIFDTNNKPSIGQFQFQKNTVIYYYRTLYGKEITPKEAVIIALDAEKSRELAIKVMFETKNKAGKDWFNCTERHGLDDKIDLIKKLEA